MSFYFKRSLLLALLSSISIGFTVGSALAQVPSGQGQKGRLADGRAYRVDEKGYRLVDRIAELEVGNDDLRRQNRALEDELADLRRLVGKLSGGGRPQASPLKEKDLFPKSAPRSDYKSVPKDLVAKDIDPPNCNDLVSSLYVKLARLDKELKQRTTASGSGVCDYNSPDNPLWDQVTRLQTALMENPSKESLAREVAGREDLKQKFALVKDQLLEETGKADSFEQELDSVRKEISGLKENLVSVQSDLDQEKAKAQASSSGELRARMKAVAPRAPKKKASPPPKPQVSDAALSLARKDFRKDLKQIQQQISKRKTLLDRLKKQKRNISIQVQPLITKRGVSLDRLRSEVSRLNQHSSIGEIRIALREINKILTDDIAVVSRLLGGRRG